MKKILLIGLTAVSMFAMGADTIQSLHVCKTPNQVYLISVTDNEGLGQALWIDEWDNLIDNPASLMIPVQTKNSFKSTKSITEWVSKTFGKSSCVKMTEQEVDNELKIQADAYQKSLK